jgi:hypothetical protein
MEVPSLVMPKVVYLWPFGQGRLIGIILIQKRTGGQVRMDLMGSSYIPKGLTFSLYFP